MSVIEKARAHGQLVYSFDQSKSPVVTEPGPWGSGFDGICAGLAIRWIKLRMLGRDYAYDHRSLEMTGVDYQAVVRQNIIDDTWAKSGPAPALLSAGLRCGPKVVTAKGKIYLGQMKSAIETSGHYLIVLKGENGAHAIALVTEPGCKVHRLFDANSGHFRYSWGTAMCKYWLYEYLAECGYTDRYRVGTTVHRVSLLLHEIPDSPGPRRGAVAGSRSAGAALSSNV